MPKSQKQSAHVQEVACYLTWLNLIGCSIANATEECFNISKRYSSLSRLELCLTQDVLSLVDELQTISIIQKQKSAYRY
jgi:hypothetical protein